MRRMIPQKQIEALDKLDEHIKVNQYHQVIINGGLKIGVFTQQFRLCAEDDNNTSICNADWTTLYPIFPSEFSWDGKPVFANKLNDAEWTTADKLQVVGQNILISKDAFNTLAPTKLGFYNDEAEDYFIPTNINKIEIMSTYGNTLTYVWDDDESGFIIESFTPLTGTQIGSISFKIQDNHSPVLFEL